MGYNTGMIERIICYGDSNTYGYDPRSYLGGRYGEDERWVDLLARGLGVECANRGENGLRIPRRALPPLAAGERMIVMLGANDLLCGEGAGECAHRLDALLEMSGVEPFAALIVAPPPFERGAWVESGALIDASRALAAEYADVAARRGQHFADAAAWGVEPAFDGVHFTAAGHRAFACGIEQSVRLAFITREV